MRKVIGYGLQGAVGAGLFAVTAVSMGFVGAVLAWSIALAITAVLFYAINLTM
jgi:hypothetical protein